VFLLGDRRGVSAVEFALIVPLLILIYVGVAEINNLLTVYRRTATVAAAAADLTAQVKRVDTNELKDISAAAGAILAPYSTDPLRLVISSVVADNKNVGKVAWSYANKGATRATNSSYAVPEGLTEPGSSVIVAELTYDFTPLVGLYDFAIPVKIERTFYARPRRSLTVTRTN
jgi:Flp pilus assembly protein TadG